MSERSQARVSASEPVPAGAPPEGEAPADAVRPGAGRRRAGLVLLLATAVLVAAGFWYAFLDPGFQERFSRQLGQSWTKAYQQLLREFFLNPWFYGVFALILVLERLVPAREEQSPASTGLRQDLWWVPVKILSTGAALPLYVMVLGYFYQQYLGFLTIDTVAAWPWLARVVLAVLVGDFLFWLSHFVRHKVRTLWYFHAVHHSQRELNFFTEYRVHPIDDLWTWTIGFIPLFMVEHSFATIVAVVWIRHWHTRLYHSNIRSSFGLLRYLLVTPQSHRVHHSSEPRHFDKNFGLTFSIWDHLFGTQYRNYDEYPETGIPDGEFPFEQEGMRLGGLSNLVEQLLYPFKSIARGS